MALWINFVLKAQMDSQMSIVHPIINQMSMFKGKLDTSGWS